MFTNLRNKINAELAISVEKAMGNYEEYLTAKEVEKVTSGKKTLGDYANKIQSKVIKRSFQKYFDKLDSAEQITGKVTDISISVEWFKSATWGSNPEAKITVTYDNDRVERFSSPRVSGCGYDKESTAIGIALSQCAGILKELYSIKESNMDKSNGECIGYGAGYGILPYFEGGVGFGCHRSILEKLGFTNNHLSSGKSYDNYYFTRNK